MEEKIKIRFWGTRGSIPTPGRNTIKYGGNTSCVEVRVAGQLFIFDAGTGIRELGNLLKTQKGPCKAYIFLSHHHWDHIQGLPFFLPAYVAGNEFTILGANHPQASLEKIISDQMESVYFPVTLSYLSAKINFQHLTEGSFNIANVQIDTIATNHPALTFSYRLTQGGKKIVYMTDNEIEPQEIASSNMMDKRKKMLDFISHVDILIHDAQYSDEEYLLYKKEWGHSPWREALKLALDGNVKTLILFHHDPDHGDEVIDSFVEECQKEIKRKGSKMKCLGAREGMELNV